MNGEQKHLTIEQIEHLLEIQPGAAENPGESDLLDEARHHLANCDTCQRLVSMEKECDQALRSLSAPDGAVMLAASSVDAAQGEGPD